jgi:hypothetical protein
MQQDELIRLSTSVSGTFSPCNIQPSQNPIATACLVCLQSIESCVLRRYGQEDLPLARYCAYCYSDIRSRAQGSASLSPDTVIEKLKAAQDHLQYAHHLRPTHCNLSLLPRTDLMYIKECDELIFVLTRMKTIILAVVSSTRDLHENNAASVAVSPSCILAPRTFPFILDWARRGDSSFGLTYILRDKT